MKKKSKFLCVVAPAILATTLVGCNGNSSAQSSFTVTFDCSGIQESIPSQTIKRGGSVSRPSITPTPKKETQKFTNYYLGNKVYTFLEPVVSDITIDVRVVDNYHTVTLDPDSLLEAEKREVPVLHTKEIPQSQLERHTPKNSDYNFYGWLDENGELFNVSSPITKDITLYPGLVENWININPTAGQDKFNIDFDDAKNNAVEFEASINGVTSDFEPTWRVVPGYEDLIEIEGVAGTKKCNIKVKSDATKGGIAYIYAYVSHSSGIYRGAIQLSIGSFSKLSSSDLKNGTAKAASNNISGGVVIPDEYCDTESIPGTSTWVKTTYIYEEGFKDVTGITSVVFGNNITSIGEYAFRGCSGLVDTLITDAVVLNDGLLTIGAHAFDRCSNLSYIHIPSSVTKIDQYAFIYTNLQRALFAYTDSWKYSSKTPYVVSKYLLDDEYTAAHCLSTLYCDRAITREEGTDPMLNLKSVTLEINGNYTSHCDLYSNQEVSYESRKPSVASVQDGRVTAIAEGTAEIRAHNYNNSYTPCSVKVEKSEKLEHANNPYGQPGGIRCKSASKSALTYVSLPDKINYGSGSSAEVTCVSTNGFNGCSGIESIYLPEKIKILGEAAFKDCENLQTVAISLSSNLEHIFPDAFRNCRKLKYINLPDTVIDIASGAFSNSGLESITLPSNPQYTTIQSGMFATCAALSCVVIPTNVTRIEPSVFANCSMLNEVYYLGSVDEFTDDVTKVAGWASGAGFAQSGGVVHCSDGDWNWQ